MLRCRRQTTPRNARWCFPGSANKVGKLISRARDPHKPFSFMRETGAGDGIRTHDPTLGKVVLYP